MNMMKAGTTKTTTTENPDGTVTTTTTTYKADGSKVVKRKTAHKPTAKSQDSKSFGAKLPVDNRGSLARAASSGNMMKRASSVKNMRRTSSSKSLKRSSSTGNMVKELVGEIKGELKKVLGVGHADDAAFQNKVARAIPAEIVLIASQDDVTQAQEGHKARVKYGLPSIPGTHGDSGSLATCGLLQLLFESPQRVVADKNAGEKPMNCRQVLTEVKDRVKACSSLQQANPVISSSRPLGPPALPEYAPFYIVPPGFTGKRRALLISAVKGEGEDLQGAPNDIQYTRHFLTKHAGFDDKDVTVLRDDRHAPAGCPRSTKQNILDGFAKLVKQSKPKDIVFIQFSGHGGRLGDNLYILPSDYKTEGQIMDDDILKDLIKYMPSKVHTTMLVDCCYSGCIGDLPYSLQSKNMDQQAIEEYYDTDTRQEMIEQEEKGGEEYKEKKKARSKWRNVNRIATVAKSYAQEFAKDMSKAAESAGKAANQAAEVAGKAANQAAEVAGKAANQAADAAGKAANKAGKAAGKAANQAAEAAEAGSKAVKSALDKGSDHVRSSLRSSGSTASSTASSDGNLDDDERGGTAKRPSIPRSRSINKGMVMPRDDRPDIASESPRQSPRNSPKRMAAVRSPRRGSMPALRPIPRNSSKGDISKAAEQAARGGSPAATARPRNSTGSIKRPPRRSKSMATAEDPGPKATPMKKNSLPRRSKSTGVNPATVAAMKANKAGPTKSLGDIAKEMELAERKAAVERSKREAAEARAAKAKA